VANWDEYLDYAERCLSIARTLTNREARVTLREMAAEWTRLAVALDSEHAVRQLAE
jgi:D-serine deaminase-like pyridoxal phosphate-dependent protein